MAWLDNSNNANCFKNTYIEGFIDVSGGSIRTYNDEGKLMISGDASFNKNVYVKSGLHIEEHNGIDSGLSLNNTLVQSTAIELNRLSNATAANDTAGKVVLLNDSNGVSIGSMNISNEVLPTTDNEVSIGNNNFSFKEIHVKDSNIYQRLFVNGDASLNGGLYISGDLSWNSANIADNSIPQSAIIGGVGSNDFTSLVSMVDLSVNDRLFVGGDVSFNNDLYVNGNTITHNIIPETGSTYSLGSASAPFNSLYVAQNSIHFTLDAIPGVDNVALSITDSGQLSINAKNGDTTITSLGESLMKINDIVNIDGNLIVSEDASMNGRFFINGDMSLNSGLYVGGDLSWNSANIADNSIPQSAIIGGVGGDNNFTSLVSMVDLSVNDRLFVGGIADFKNINVSVDVSRNNNVVIYCDASLNGPTTVDGIYYEYNPTTNFPVSISGNFPVNQSADRNQYTQTVSSYTGSDAWKNGGYTVMASSFSSYGNSNPENVFHSSYNSAAQNRWSTGREPHYALNYIDDTGNTQVFEYSANRHQAWIYIDYPYLMKPTLCSISSRYGMSVVGFLGVDQDGQMRLLQNWQGAGTNNDSDTRSYAINTDYYVSRIYLFLVQNNNDQDAFMRIGYVAYEGQIKVQLKHPFIVNTLSVFNNNVSIGATDSQGYALYVSGNSFTTGTATSSDNRLKHNEEIIENALDTICKLQPKHYYKTTEMYDENHHFSFDTSGNMVDICGNIIQVPPEEDGFIAQEVENIPELNFAVRKGSATTPYGIDYNSIFIRSIKAIQELNAKLQEEQDTIAELESRLSDIITRLDNLENA